MKISRSIFEKGILPGLNKNNKEVHPILLFLRKNSKWAFNVEDIVKATKLTANNCHRMLRILEKKKLIERGKCQGSNKSFYIISRERKKAQKAKKMTTVVKINFKKTKKKRR